MQRQALGWKVVEVLTMEGSRLLPVHLRRLARHPHCYEMVDTDLEEEQRQKAPVLEEEVKYRGGEQT